jgi:hypothetical protein
MGPPSHEDGIDKVKPAVRAFGVNQTLHSHCSKRFQIFQGISAKTFRRCDRSILLCLPGLLYAADTVK